MHRLSTPLVPKAPAGPLRVLLIGRVSTIHQDLENIAASFRPLEAMLDEGYPGPKLIRRLGEQGSGMSTERPSIVEAEELIATGTWDLVMAEDIARFYRNPRHAMAFVQNAYDKETRVICPGDNLD